MSPSSCEEMTSSALPREAKTSVRIVLRIVSPVPNAAEMIVVASMSPITMRTARPSRRGTFRTLKRKSTGSRRALNKANAMMATVMPRKTHMSTSTGAPNSVLMSSDLLPCAILGADLRRRLRKNHLVLLSPRRLAHEGNELRDLFLVIATLDSGLGGLLALPERHHHALALRRPHHIYAGEARLLLNQRKDLLH